MKRKYTVFDTVRLKRNDLKTKLKILGYNNITEVEKELDPSNGYMVLGRIGNSLENYTDPVRIALSYKQNADEKIDKYSQEIEEEKTFIENQEEFYRRVRSIYPEFGLHMKEKITPSDWNLYSETVQQTANLLIDLSIGSPKRDLTRIPDKKQQDIISELIDSHQFAEACKIEDTFMTEEFEIFKKTAETLGYDDETVSQTSACLMLAELVRDANSLINKKGRYISRFQKYDEFVKNLNDKVTIKQKEVPDGSSPEENLGEGTGRDDD